MYLNATVQWEVQFGFRPLGRGGREVLLRSEKVEKPSVCYESDIMTDKTPQSSVCCYIHKWLLTGLCMLPRRMT